MSTTTAKSWGHTITPRQFHSAKCSNRHCDEQPTFEVSYRYITGRAGRVSTAKRSYCPMHAAAFAERHGLVPPPPLPPVNTAACVRAAAEDVVKRFGGFSEADDDGHLDRQGHVQEMRGVK